MRVVLSVICAALLVILAMSAALWLLAGDFIGAGLFLLLTIATAVILWLAVEPKKEI